MTDGGGLWKAAAKTGFAPRPARCSAGEKNGEGKRSGPARRAGAKRPEPALAGRTKGRSPLEVVGKVFFGNGLPRRRHPLPPESAGVGAPLQAPAGRGSTSTCKGRRPFGDRADEAQGAPAAGYFSGNRRMRSSTVSRRRMSLALPSRPIRTSAGRQRWV